MKGISTIPSSDCLGLDALLTKCPGDGDPRVTAPGIVVTPGERGVDLWPLPLTCVSGQSHHNTGGKEREEPSFWI